MSNVLIYLATLVAGTLCLVAVAGAVALLVTVIWFGAMSGAAWFHGGDIDGI